MNMHASIQAADRTLLPRGLIARGPVRRHRIRWKFELGAMVEFADQPAVVIDRSITAMGRQLYDIMILGPNHGGRRHRTVLGIALSKSTSQNPMAEQVSRENSRKTSIAPGAVQEPPREVLLL